MPFLILLVLLFLVAMVLVFAGTFSSREQKYMEDHEKYRNAQESLFSDDD